MGSPKRSFTAFWNCSTDRRQMRRGIGASGEHCDDDPPVPLPPEPVVLPGPEVDPEPPAPVDEPDGCPFPIWSPTLPVQPSAASEITQAKLLAFMHVSCASG